MNNNGLIDWIYANAPVNRWSLQWQFPAVERFCETHRISIGEFAQRIIQVTCLGVTLAQAIDDIREQEEQR